MDNQTGVVCPRNTAWLSKLLEVLPPGLRGKLAPYEVCQTVRRNLSRSRGHKPGRSVVRPVLRVRKGQGPENLATMRHMALNLLRRETCSKGGVKAKRLRSGWDEDYLIKVLSL